MIPEIGLGATVCLWSDRLPYTIIKVSKSGKTITLQADRYHRLDSNGMSEDQRYIYQPNINGDIIKASLRKNGVFRVSKTNCSVILGFRQRYYDYSF